jgi:hypothetical protein
VPNAFLKPEVIAAVAMERLRRELILPRLVTRMGLADFRGAKDDTVNIRVPSILTARDYEFRTRNNPIVIDMLQEQTIAVKLDKHVYSAIAVTDEELTLDIVSFAIQVLQPQVIAVAERLESLIAEMIAGASYAASDLSYTEGDDQGFYNALVDARKVLNDAHIPMSGRVALIGSSVEASALKEITFVNASQSGSTDALRNATIGQVAGFTVVTTQSLPEDFAIAFHPSAFAFANVAPEVPAGVPFGSSQSESGLAMRWIRDYDPNYLRDRSVISSFAGSASVNDGREGGSGSTSDDLNDTNIRAVKIDFVAAS